MPQIWLASRLRALTGGEKEVEVPGATVRQVIDQLETRYPGAKAALYDPERDAMAAGIAVIVDGESCQLGLLERLQPDSEVHFLPAIAGGAGFSGTPYSDDWG
ncbi:MAG: molybdopterin synthase sulfur carrier subunit [Candidatus Latescibacteria bacterium]|nr:molybdopterin synthase sulfur carrier subunit [Candidatus Latescibacterota bacterium]